MAVQPLVKEIQVKYKDNPEKQQQEMLRLYKEYGFNPMAGCLPMLLPWPILIALFFVFQNTIEFRGVPFLWMPDLSAPDPLYVLPIFLAVSMFALQYMSFKAMPQDNPQMKFMMWFFPLFFGFLFMRFAAGLNLYYSVSNLATIPQQYWTQKERQKAAAKGPQKLSERDRK
jgi:YidC/Oxa1 family membrane protein insertase